MTHWFKAGSAALLSLLLPFSTPAADKAVSPEAKPRAAAKDITMPWFALRDMSDADLRAIYRYIRHLGPGGQPAPAYVPPGQEPKPPSVMFPQ